MQPSASAAHTTDFHREPKWEPPRRAFGILGICITAAGVAIFVYFFSTHHFDAGVTAHGMGFAALAVTLSLGGLQTARWGFASQRAYDTKRAFIEDLAGMYARLDTIAEKIDGIAAQSDRLERMERVLLTLTDRFEAVRDIADRLAAIEQGMTALARAVRETAEQQSSEASRFEVRLEVLFRQIGDALAMLGKISLEMPNREQIVAEVREQVLDDLREELAGALKEAYANGVTDALEGGSNVRRLPGPDQR